MTTHSAAPAAPAPDGMPPAAPPSGKRRPRFPSAFTVLAIVTLAVWVLTFVIPTGRYDTKDGSPVPDTYHTVELATGFWDRLKDLFLAPVNGLYGVTDAHSGLTAPGGSGDFFGAAGVFLFVLAVGAFITVTMRTGALTSGVAASPDGSHTTAHSCSWCCSPCSRWAVRRTAWQRKPSASTP